MSLEVIAVTLRKIPRPELEVARSTRHRVCRKRRRKLEAVKEAMKLVGVREEGAEDKMR